MAKLTLDKSKLLGFRLVKVAGAVAIGAKVGIKPADGGRFTPTMQSVK